jgi:hypothetical protein
LRAKIVGDQSASSNPEVLRHRKWTFTMDEDFAGAGMTTETAQKGPLLRWH